MTGASAPFFWRNTMLADYYQRIQLIMAHLGYYNGEFDGIWGPACVQAKRDWEMADEFEPAAPNGGLPFRVNGKVPKGLHWGIRTKGLMCAGLTEDRVQELLKSRKGIVTAIDVERVQKPVLSGTQTEASDPGLYHKVVEDEEEPVQDTTQVSEPEPERQPVPEYLATQEESVESELSEDSPEEDSPTKQDPKEDLVEDEVATKVSQPWTAKKKKK